jgi:putative transposase
VLDHKFNVAAPNQVWAADFTYIATEQGWFYLAVVIDLFSRRIVGCALPRNRCARICAAIA